jgi:hypothetical protein
LKEDWTFRWLLDPQRIMPGTLMPSQLFKRDGDRWVFNGPLPPSAAEYKGDHARLLVRYMLSLTPEEQARARAAQPAQAPAPSATPATPVASHTPGVAPKRQNASSSVAKRGRRTQVSERRRQRRTSRERWRQAAVLRARARDFSP